MKHIKVNYFNKVKRTNQNKKETLLILLVLLLFALPFLLEL